MFLSPQDFFKDHDVSEVSEWGKHAKYHDVHVSNSDYVITYLDPTVYTAWCLYNTLTDLPDNYITKLSYWNSRVCYFTYPVTESEPLRQPVTMRLSSDLFPDTEFTHRIIL